MAPPVISFKRNQWEGERERDLRISSELSLAKVREGTDVDMVYGEDNLVEKL